MTRDEQYEMAFDDFLAAARDAGLDGEEYDPDTWAEAHGVHVDDAACRLADGEYKAGLRLAADSLNWHARTDGHGAWANAKTKDNVLVSVTTYDGRAWVHEQDERTGAAIRLIAGYPSAPDAIAHLGLVAP